MTKTEKLLIDQLIAEKMHSIHADIKEEKSKDETIKDMIKIDRLITDFMQYYTIWEKISKGIIQ